MSRSRRNAVDNTVFENSGISWTFRRASDADEANPAPPPEDDRDNSSSFPISLGAGAAWQSVTVWGNGLLSFGPATTAQVQFMRTLRNAADISRFPGDYIAFNFSLLAFASYEYGAGVIDPVATPGATAPNFGDPFDPMQLNLYHMDDAQPLVYAAWTQTPSFNGLPPNIRITPSMISVGGGPAGGIYGARLGGREFGFTASSGLSLLLSDLSQIAGTAVADALQGTNAAETLLGLDGDDFLDGVGGSDTLIGGTGNDILRGGLENDRLFGDAGNDRLFGEADNDLLEGGDGDDFLDGGINDDTLNGGAGIDTAVLDFSALNPTRQLIYYESRSPSRAPAGTVLGVDYQFVPGVSVATGNGVKQLIGIEAASIRGSDRDDILAGGASNDELIGGFGDDVLLGGAGNDVLRGGATDSRTDVFDSTGTLSLLYRDGPETYLSNAFDLESNAAIAQSTQIPHATVLAAGADLVASYEFYVSQAGARAIFDVDDSANLNSFLVLKRGADVVAFNGDAATVDVGSASTADSYLEYTFTSPGFYKVEIGAQGGATPQSILAVPIAAYFTLHASLDYARGNILDGGAGDDTYYVEAPIDVVRELPLQGYDRVYTTVSYRLPRAVEWIAAANPAATTAIDLTGNALANALTGNAGANILEGAGGNDFLFGLAGNDRLTGGTGSDVIDGGDGTDTLVLSGTLRDYFALQEGGGLRIISAIDRDLVTNVEQVLLGSQTLTLQAFASGAFDGLRYIAGYADLIRGIGANADAGRQHWDAAGRAEGRDLSRFDPLAYTAAYRDLTMAFGADAQKASQHYIQAGFNEGRNARFDGLRYAASYADLTDAFGTDGAAATQHYLRFGFAEGRQVTFDPLRYTASYSDLIRGFGTDASRALNHYLSTGFDEGRRATFETLRYTATYSDLLQAFGTDEQAALRHYISWGFNEGRRPAFDPVAYLLTYSDLGASGVGVQGALRHWAAAGFREGRAGDALFGREQGSHQLAVGGVINDALATAGDRDWFEISLAAGGKVKLTLDGTGFDAFLTVHDSLGKMVAFADNGGPGQGDASFTFTASLGGTYYVVADSAAHNGAGNYVLSAEPVLA